MKNRLKLTAMQRFSVTYWTHNVVMDLDVRKDGDDLLLRFPEYPGPLRFSEAAADIDSPTFREYLFRLTEEWLGRPINFSAKIPEVREIAPETPGQAPRYEFEFKL